MKKRISLNNSQCALKFVVLVERDEVGGRRKLGEGEYLYLLSWEGRSEVNLLFRPNYDETIHNYYKLMRMTKD